MVWEPILFHKSIGVSLNIAWSSRALDRPSWSELTKSQAVLIAATVCGDVLVLDLLAADKQTKGGNSAGPTSYVYHEKETAETWAQLYEEQIKLKTDSL